MNHIATFLVSINEDEDRPDAEITEITDMLDDEIHRAVNAVCETYNVKLTVTYN